MTLSVAHRDRSVGAEIAPIRVLMELHHCLQAFSGISQETRLEFAELAANPYLSLRVGGLIDPGSDLWTARRRSPADTLTQARCISELDRLSNRRKIRKTLAETMASRYRKSRLAWLARLMRNFLVGDDLFLLDSFVYRDFLWEKLFATTLAADNRPAVLKPSFFVVHTGRRSAARAVRLRSWSARIDTAGWDVLIAQTPFPYRLHPATRLIVRYHDAIPVFYPHMVSEGEREANVHIRVLLENVRRGAFFACVSEPVREDLLRIAPQAEGRAAVIPNMVSPLFSPEPAAAAALTEILRTRSCPPASLAAGDDKKRRDCTVDDDRQVSVEFSSRFFLAVSTLEPRKNYPLLINAWAGLRSRHAETPDLVLIANPGWRFAEAAAAISRWRGRGLFHLWKVPIEELRLLYSSAQAVVCPSLVEGFDLSGVEAMLCNTPVIASDIPVHRSVYGDAAMYFDPFDTSGLQRLLEEAGRHLKSEGMLAAFSARGLRQGALYRPEVIVSRWHAFLEKVHAIGRPSYGGAGQMAKGHESIDRDICHEEPLE